MALFPLVLIYYFSVGARHRLSWHLSLWGALLGGAVVNSFWLVDWLDYCWIRAPLQAELPLLAHRTLATVWAAPLWGEHADRVWTSVLFCAAVVGVWYLLLGLPFLCPFCPWNHVLTYVALVLAVRIWRLTPHPPHHEPLTPLLGLVAVCVGWFWAWQAAWFLAEATVLRKN